MKKTFNSFLGFCEPLWKAICDGFLKFVTTAVAAGLTICISCYYQESILDKALDFKATYVKEALNLSLKSEVVESSVKLLFFNGYRFF